MTRGEDYVLLLRETSKLTLFVSINMGAKIYSFCAKHEIFNPVNPLDFIEFLNIRETQMPINPTFTFLTFFKKVLTEKQRVRSPKRSKVQCRTQRIEFFVVTLHA